MDIREQIRNYTRNEIPIYGENSFNEMLNLWSNETDVTVYRGINFSTKEKYEKFMLEMKNNGGYISSTCDGFSACYDTAYEFSTTTKTYFPTLEVVMADAKRSVLAEKMSGYCGVVLKAFAPKGTVVDVNRSGEAIESEILFRANTLIKCEVEKIKTFKEIVNSKTFNINEYIKNNNKEKDGLLEYILTNKNRSLNDESREILLNRHLEKYIKTKGSIKDNKNQLLNETYIVAELCASGKFGDDTKKIRFYIPNFRSLEINNLLKAPQLEIVKKIANEIIMSVMNFHIEYRDKYKIEYNAIKNITPYINKDNQELFSRVIAYKKKDTYEKHTDTIREFFKNKDLSSSERSRLVEKEVDKLKEFLNGIIEDLPDTKKDLIIEKKQRAKRRKDILNPK